MAGSYAASLFSRMFSCAPRAPPERKCDLSNEDVVSEMSGASEVLVERPFSKSKKAVRVPRDTVKAKPRRRPGVEKTKPESGSESGPGSEPRRSGRKDKSKRTDRDRDKSRRTDRDRDKSKRTDRHEQGTERTGRKVRDLLEEQPRRSTRRGTDASDDEEDSERAISKRLESLLQNPPSRRGARGSSTGRAARGAAPRYLAPDKRATPESSSSRGEGTGGKRQREHLSGSEETNGGVERVAPTSESAPATSTESLRNPALRQGFGAHRATDSESTVDSTCRDRPSGEHSSDNETDVSYMIDFYDKIHFNRILAKRMANFLVRKKK